MSRLVLGVRKNFSFLFTAGVILGIYLGEYPYSAWVVL